MLGRLDCNRSRRRSRATVQDACVCVAATCIVIQSSFWASGSFKAQDDSAIRKERVCFPVTLTCNRPHRTQAWFRLAFSVMAAVVAVASLHPSGIWTNAVSKLGSPLAAGTGTRLKQVCPFRASNAGYLASGNVGLRRPQRKASSRQGSVLRAASATEAVLEVEKGPEELISTLLSLVEGTDRGAALGKEEQARINDIAKELEQFCVPEPLTDPRIFGEWDIVYCSDPRAPGGYYRSVVGRALLRTDAMVQTLKAPDFVGNKVVFALLGLIGGEVSLRGKLTVQDKNWIQIVFDSPNLKFGPAEFQYGGNSTVKIAVTYLDETLRLGRGSRGSLFIFRRQP